MPCIRPALHPVLSSFVLSFTSQFLSWFFCIAPTHPLHESLFYYRYRSRIRRSINDILTFPYYDWRVVGVTWSTIALFPLVSACFSAYGLFQHLFIQFWYHPLLATTMSYLGNCPICLSDYKEPYSIPCGHLFCLECLSEYISNSSRNSLTASCPSCRDEFLLGMLLPASIYLHLTLLS